jgi:hypothetical protein
MTRAELVWMCVAFFALGGVACSSVVYCALWAAKWADQERERMERERDAVWDADREQP